MLMTLDPSRVTLRYTCEGCSQVSNQPLDDVPHVGMLICGNSDCDHEGDDLILEGVEVTTEPKPKRVAIVCSRCGGKDVARDATAHWDEDTQEWALGQKWVLGVGSMQDNAYCNTCEDDVKLEERVIEP